MTTTTTALDRLYNDNPRHCLQIEQLQGPYLFKAGKWELLITRITPQGQRALIELQCNKVPIYAQVRTPLSFSVGDIVKANITIVTKDEVEYNHVTILP